MSQHPPSAVVACAVIHIDFPEKPPRGQNSKASGLLSRTPSQKLEEATGLAIALDLDVRLHEVIKISQINPATFMGKGKVEEVGLHLAELNTELVIVNQALSPTQQRNLELAWKAKVLDRPGLILEIFADRARTHAGRLQVELAQLVYQQSRLVRTWTHLERQRGGLGKTGGPGERQIELDRRMIRDRITRIREELGEVEKTRQIHRKARTKSGLPVVALVGYTNAGKSTLFNALVGEEAFVKNMLFATLDPLMRKMRLPGGRDIILSDTVGFISDLPHQLVEAFHATLEEVRLADLLLHVHDASSPDAAIQTQDVLGVLKTIEADKVPVIDVWNKADLMDVPHDEAAGGTLVSALTGKGVDTLLAAIEANFASREEVHTFTVPAADGRRLAWLHAHGEVLAMDLAGSDYTVNVRLSHEDAMIFQQMLG